MVVMTIIVIVIMNSIPDTFLTLFVFSSLIN